MGRKGGKRRRRTGFAVIFFAIAVIAIVGIAYLIHQERRPGLEKPVSTQKEKKTSRPEQGPPPRVVQPAEDQDTRKPSIPRPEIGKALPGTIKVAIIIDDIGYDLKPVRELINIGEPLTFAILPYEPHSVEAASRLHREGQEVLLHLPMEPHNYPETKPGKGALLVGMNDDALRRQIEKDLSAVPHAVGVNNHMGSRLMEDRGKVAIVLKQLKQRNLFFVDSRTTPLSVGAEMAERVGLPYGERKVFIDNEGNFEKTFQSLMALAETKGSDSRQTMIVIGHPRESTVKALQKAIPLLKEKGVRFVSASDALRDNPHKTISRK